MYNLLTLIVCVNITYFNCMNNWIPNGEITVGASNVNAQRHAVRLVLRF